MQATALIDFSKVVGTISPFAWGTNLYQGLTTDITNDPSYQANVGGMLGGRGFIRIHREDMMTAEPGTGSAWLIWTPGDASAPVTWNYTHIRASLANAFWTKEDRGGDRVMLCFSAWPAIWNTPNKTLDQQYWPAYVQLLSDFVLFVNGPASAGNLSLGIRYFEVTNEMDQPYAAMKQTALLAQLVVAGSKAIKAADPTAKTGGPAWARADITQNVVDFVQASTPSGVIDFVSYHAYATGSTSTANSSIYGTAASPFLTTGVKQVLQSYAPRNGSDILLFHDENNISWDPPDTRMGNQVGAVFDALFATSAVSAGATAAARWNEADGAYKWTTLPSMLTECV